MYKDKDKQREANKEAAKRYRDGKTAVVELIPGMTANGMAQGMTDVGIIPKSDIRVIPDEATPTRAGMDIMNESLKRIKPQSYNPMMVGYVPPKDEI